MSLSNEVEVRVNHLLLYFTGKISEVRRGVPEKLKILATRSENFRNLRSRFYLLLCSLTPQQAAGDARAIVFIDKLPSYLIKGRILKQTVFPSSGRVRMHASPPAKRVLERINLNGGGHHESERKNQQ